MTEIGPFPDSPDLEGGTKVAAVEVWELAVDEIPADCEHREFFQEADIHHRRDRQQIEDLIDHELPAEDWALALADAFDDLHNHFEEVWT